MIIPKGRKFEILMKTKHDSSIVVPKALEKVALILDNEITLSVSSSFSKVVSEGSAQATAISQLISAAASKVLRKEYSISGSFQEFGAQVWESTTPISLNLSFSLYPRDNHNTFDSVMHPTLFLMKQVLPTPVEVGSGIGLKYPGINIIPIAASGITGKSTTAWDKFIAVSFGNIFLVPVIIKKVEPTFGTDVDSEGDYIYAKISMDIETVFTATTNMIDEMYRGRGKISS